MALYTAKPLSHTRAHRSGYSPLLHYQSCRHAISTLYREIDPFYPLPTFSIHSPAAIETRNWIWDETKADVGILDLLSGLSIQDLDKKYCREKQTFLIS